MDWGLVDGVFVGEGTATSSVTDSFHVQVDVWAVGVMLYQMVYGKRPFGEGCSQEEILRDDIMLNARQVIFPAKPAVSPECKEFISRSAERPSPHSQLLAYTDLRMDGSAVTQVLVKVTLHGLTCMQCASGHGESS